ncbi:MAG: PVC-type heme-binding CxxCH protein, partial [Planctomyces sp.]
REWFAELRVDPFTGREADQPFADQTGSLPLGQIRTLDDTNGDGVFDQSKVFAEGLSWPTGLALWKGGVFVVATPDLWYLRDTDDDGVADVRQKVLTGFRKFNIQAVINNLKWGLDHRLYGAGSSNGGRIRSADVSDETEVLMPTGDFRFQAASPGATFEVLSGGARFGNTFNDWGDRFICNIRNPIQQVVIPRHYTARNPAGVYAPVLHDAAASGDSVPVKRRSPPEPWRVMNARRLASDSTLASPRSETVAAGYMTSAAGVTIYRGDAYPPEYYGSVFLGEVAGNLIHHERLVQNGILYDAVPSDPEREFLASTDNWFRPVNFVNAPDGTLHVLDMYRETIEHPWSIPDDIKAQLDLESGRDRGRIYRLAPKNFRLRESPRLGSATTSELVALLSDARGWYRDTAHRLIFERQDSLAVEPLRRLIRTLPTPIEGPDSAVLNHRKSSPEGAYDLPAVGRLLALWSLDGLRELSDDDLMHGLRDPHPRVRSQAVLLAEPRLSINDRIRSEVLSMADDDSIEVRFQTGFSLGELLRETPVQQKLSSESSGSDLTVQQAQIRDAAIGALAEISLRDASSPLIRSAVLSSVGQVSVPLMNEILRRPSDHSDDTEFRAGRTELIRSLASVVGVRADPVETKQFFEVVASQPGFEDDTARQQDLIAVVIGLGKGMKRSGRSVRETLEKESSPGAGRLAAVLRSSIDELSKEADGVVLVQDDQRQKIELLELAEFSTAREILVPWLRETHSSEAQSIAVRVLSGHGNSLVIDDLLQAYRGLQAAGRMAVVEALLSRAEWHPRLLDAVENGTIAVFDVPQLRRNLLLRSSNKEVSGKASGLFAAATESRQKVVNEYRDAMIMLQGDRQQGEAVYRRECQSCHRSGSEGQELGPNLATIRNRAPEEVVLHILDPNREVGSNYVAQVVILNDGRNLTGIISREDAATVTLKAPSGSETVISRSEISELTSTGQSLMPVGFEQRISTQEMSSLVEFLLR